MKDSQIKIIPKSGRAIFLQGEDAKEVYEHLRNIFKEEPDDSVIALAYQKGKADEWQRIQKMLNLITYDEWSRGR